jgi:hypothetical protein
LLKKPLRQGHTFGGVHRLRYERIDASACRCKSTQVFAIVAGDHDNRDFGLAFQAAEGSGELKAVWGGHVKVNDGQSNVMGSSPNQGLLGALKAERLEFAELFDRASIKHEVRRMIIDDQHVHLGHIVPVIGRQDSRL